MCVHAHVSAYGGPRLTLDVFLYHSPHYILRPGAKAELSAAIWLASSGVCGGGRVVVEYYVN